MKLKTWAKTSQHRKLLIEHTKLSEAAICRLVNGKCKVEPRHFRAIETATGNQVTRIDMRPDMFK